MTEFQELIKDAPKFASMERGELVAYAYGMYAAAVKADAENDRLRELVRDMFACISHANEADWFYFERDKLGCGMRCVVNGEGCGLPVLADRMRELGVEVDG